MLFLDKNFQKIFKNLFSGILTVDIQTKDESDKKRIFEVLIDDPTIASLKHMAICTTKGSRGKIGLFKDEGKSMVYYRGDTLECNIWS